jgi:hypothetical protein
MNANILKGLCIIHTVTMLLCLAFPVNAANIVAAWTMDETNDGKKIIDATGSKHNGEILGKVKRVDGKIGKGIQFNGVGDHVEVPDPDHKLTPEHIGMVAWVKLDNVAGNHSILEQYDWAGDLGTHAWRTNGPALQFFVIWGTTAPNANGGNLKANEWMHVAATYDGENIKTWINGKVAGEAKAAKRDLNPSNKSLSIGVRGDTKDVHWMTGVLDEIAVFDEALTEKELKAIIDNPKGLAGVYLAVEPAAKLTTAWGKIKMR